MINKVFSILGVVLILLASTESSAQKLKKNKTLKLKEGVEIKLTEKGKGKLPLMNDVVKYDLTILNLNDSILEPTKELSTRIGSVQRNSISDALELMKKGSKVEMTNAQSKMVINSLDITSAPLAFKTKKKDTVTFESGLQIITLDKGVGKAVEKEDMVTLDYTGYFRSGKIFDSSVERKAPFTFKAGVGQVIKGFDEAITSMNVGAKSRVIIPWKLAYGDKARGPIPAKSDLIFDLHIQDAKAPAVPVPFETAGFDTITLESGLQYIKVLETDSAMPLSGHKVKVHYTGYFMDGSTFDSSVSRGMPFEFILGRGNVIQGWDIGIGMLKKGEKARLIIPPGLGYGASENGPIPANSVLIFDVELIDFQ